MKDDDKTKTLVAVDVNTGEGLELHGDSDDVTTSEATPSDEIQAEENQRDQTEEASNENFAKASNEKINYAVPPSDENDPEQIRSTAADHLRSSKENLEREQNSPEQVLARKNHKRRTTTAVSTIIGSLSATVTFTMALVMFIYVQIQIDLNSYFIKNTAALSIMKQHNSIAIATIIVGTILTIVMVILATRSTGRLNSDNKVELNMFDRMFPEIKVLMGILLGCALVPMGILFLRYFAYSPYLIKMVKGMNLDFTIDHSKDTVLYNLLHSGSSYVNPIEGIDLSPWLIKFIYAGATILIFVALAEIYLSLVRMIKGKEFWRHTILGWIIIKLSGGYDKFSEGVSKVKPAVKSAVGSVSDGVSGAFANGNAGDNSDTANSGTAGDEKDAAGKAAAETAAGTPWWYRHILPYYLLEALAFLVGLCLIPLFYEDEGFIGLYAFFLLILTVFVLVEVHRYSILKRGLEEICKGNFDYRIPLSGHGPIGSVAQQINTIVGAEQMAIRSEVKNQRMKAELISNVSHDLKTPLTSMVTYLDLLKKEGLDSENAQEYINILDDKTNRLKALVLNLFEAAKASSGDMPVNITDVNMNTFLPQVYAEFEEKLDDAEITLIRNHNPDLQSDVIVRADGELLWRVLNNMMTNLCKYSQKGSRAYSELSRNDGYVTLTLKNVSAEPLNVSADELMARFIRGDDSRTTEGSGLGLSIAKSLTELMGGKFNISIDGDLFKAEVSLKEAKY